MSEPSLLVMDEPTTGLDVTVEAAVLDLVAQLRRTRNSSIVFISHNLGTVVRICDRIGVMYAGELVEEGPIGEVFRDPRHPYTRGLLNCIPTLNADKRSRPLSAPFPARCRRSSTGPRAASLPRAAPDADGRRCTARTDPDRQFYGETGHHRVKCVRVAELPKHARPSAASGDHCAPDADSQRSGADARRR